MGVVVIDIDIDTLSYLQFLISCAVSGFGMDLYILRCGDY